MKSKRIIYGLGLVALLVMIVLNYSKAKMLEQTQDDKNVVRLPLLNVNCGNKSYFVFKGKNSNHIVNIEKDSCLPYKVGDTVTLLYNADHDLYFLQPITTRNEYLALVGFSIFFVIILIFFLFPNKFSKSNT